MSIGKTVWEKMCNQDVHHLDKYINIDYIISEFKEGKIGIPDVHGLGNLKWYTPSGSVRSLIGSSAKVSKSVSDNTGTPARIGQLFLSPARECYRDVNDFFPLEGWRAGSANDTLHYGVIHPRPLDVKPWFFNHPMGFGTTDVRPKSTHKTMCKYASKCKFTCLLETGNIKLDTSARSRFCKTWFFLTEPIHFLRLLLFEIRKHSITSFARNKTSYFRLNGLSDVPWEKYLNLTDMIKDFRGFGGLYDYTKAPLKHREGANPSEYRLAYSWDEKPTASRNAFDYHQAGHSVAMVVQSEKKKKPKEIMDLIQQCPHVVDGDLHDGRFSDPNGGVVLLRNKGNLKVETHLGEDEKGRQLDLITPIKTVFRFALDKIKNNGSR